MKKDQPDILYHYCSTQTFVSIITNRSVWLSHLQLSNDTMEGKLVHKILKEMALKDNLTDLLHTPMESIFKFFEEKFDGLGFCLSEGRDVLSQWRGYADNGRGVAIGFRKKYLDSLVHTVSETEWEIDLKPVVYDLKTQTKMLRPVYNKVKRMAEANKFNQPLKIHEIKAGWDAMSESYEKFMAKAEAQLYDYLKATIDDLYIMKSDAFVEEQEWRILGETSDQFRCSYRAIADRVVPYRVVQLAAVDYGDAIAEVVLGPKNSTPVGLIKNFVESKFEHAPVVQQSRASYR